MATFDEHSIDALSSHMREIDPLITFRSIARRAAAQSSVSAFGNSRPRYGVSEELAELDKNSAHTRARRKREAIDDRLVPVDKLFGGTA